MLREARERAGLTQVALARRAGVTQSMVSAYETGRRDPTYSTLERLLRATGHRLTYEPADDEPALSATLLQLRRHGGRIIEMLEASGIHHPRVFGSVARGDDHVESDIDLLVDLDPDVSVIRLIGLERELSELLGRPVDLVPAESLKPGLRESAVGESVPL